MVHLQIVWKGKPNFVLKFVWNFLSLNDFFSSLPFEQECLIKKGKTGAEQWSWHPSLAHSKISMYNHYGLIRKDGSFSILTEGFLNFYVFLVCTYLVLGFSIFLKNAYSFVS